LLFDEFNKLFNSLYQNADEYIEIIRVIARMKLGVSRSHLEQLFIALISAAGLKGNVHSNGLISGLVIAEDLFRPLE